MLMYNVSMGSIQKTLSKHGKIKYVARIRRNGYPTKCATFILKLDAKRWITLTESSILHERYMFTEESKEPEKVIRILFSDICEKYLKNLPKSKHSEIKSSQVKLWSDMLGHLHLNEITTEIVSNIRDKIATQRNMSNATIVRYLSSLSCVFTFAIEELELIDESPVKKVNKPREPKGVVRFLSSEELRLILKASIESKNPYLNTIVTIAVQTGMRKSEILNLTWEDIDLERSRIIVRHSKNGTRRSVYLSNESRVLLESIKRKHIKFAVKTNLIFPSTRKQWSKEIRKPTSIDTSWKKALKTSGVKDFRFHDLRHTCASYLAMNGASLKDISEILGHKSITMTDRYVHLCESHTKEVLRKMNERIFNT